MGNQFHVPFQMGEEKVMKVFTLEEVAQKTSPESYMLVIHNKVYDVTNFISEVNNCQKNEVSVHA